jgi:hypothetical protein
MSTREQIITKVNTETSSSGTEITALCQDKLDFIQEDICSRYDFSWLKDYSYINIIPVYDTNTVTVTQDSATVTGASTVFTSAMVGRLFQIDGEDNWYEISAYVSPTEITLASNYTGTGSGGLSYAIYKTDYPLASDFKKMIWVKQLLTPANMTAIPEAPFNQFFPDIFERTIDEDPDAYILTGIDTSGYYTIRFTPIQTTRKQIYYCYIKQLPTINTTGAISKIPTKWHDAFVFMLNVFVFNLIDIPSKATINNNLYEQTIARMIEEDLKRDKSVGFVMGKEKLGEGRIGDIW